MEIHTKYQFEHCPNISVGAFFLDEHSACGTKCGTLCVHPIRQSFWADHFISMDTEHAERSEAGSVSIQSASLLGG